MNDSLNGETVTQIVMPTMMFSVQQSCRHEAKSLDHEI